MRSIVSRLGTHWDHQPDRLRVQTGVFDWEGKPLLLACRAGSWKEGARSTCSYGFDECIGRERIGSG